MRTARVIHCVDAHAEGEPSRIIVGGVLDVPGTTMLEKARRLEREGDWLRRLCLFEPRGSAPLSADLVLPSAHPEADAGFIIMESSSYEGMSGTNTINTAAVLLETGMVELVEPVTSMVLEAPAGLVRVSRRGDRRRRRADHVRERPVVLHRARRGRRGAGRRHAAGRRRLRRRVVRVRGRRRAGLRDRPRRGARRWRNWASGSARTPPSSWRSRIRWRRRSRYLSFIVFVAPPRVGGDARHATIVSPGRLDRAPTGTATSARIAVLDKRGTLGDAYVAESVIDTTFTGRIAGRTQVGDVDAVVPAITGRAWITGFHQLVVDPTDPLRDGFKLPDTWGAGLVRGHAQPRGLIVTSTGLAPGALTCRIRRLAAARTRGRRRSESAVVPASLSLRVATAANFFVPPTRTESRIVVGALTVSFARSPCLRNVARRGRALVWTERVSAAGDVVPGFVPVVAGVQ